MRASAVTSGVLSQSQQASTTRGTMTTNLIRAVVSGKVGRVRKCLARPRVNVNSCGHGVSGYTPLMQAVDWEHRDVVTLLLAAPGIDVNLAPNNGRTTPLILAAQRGNVDITQQLLDVPGIDLHALDCNGFSAASSALQRDHFEVARLIDAAARWQSGPRRCWIQLCVSGHQIPWPM